MQTEICYRNRFCAHGNKIHRLHGIKQNQHKLVLYARQTIYRYYGQKKEIRQDIILKKITLETHEFTKNKEEIQSYNPVSHIQKHII